MRHLLYDEDGVTLEVEFLPNGDAFIHLDVDRLTPRKYRKTLEDFEVVKALLADDGIDIVYTTSLACDKKHQRFLRLYGWVEFGSAVVDDTEYLAYSMRTT